MALHGAPGMLGMATGLKNEDLAKSPPGALRNWIHRLSAEVLDSTPEHSFKGKDKGDGDFWWGDVETVGQTAGLGSSRVSLGLSDGMQSESKPSAQDLGLPRRTTVMDLNSGAQCIAFESASRAPSQASGTAQQFEFGADSDEDEVNQKPFQLEETKEAAAAVFPSEEGGRERQMFQSPFSASSHDLSVSSLYAVPWSNVSTEAKSSSRTPGDKAGSFDLFACAAKGDEGVNPYRANGFRDLLSSSVPGTPRVYGPVYPGVNQPPDQKEVWGPLPLCDRMRSEPQVETGSSNHPRAFEHHSGFGNAAAAALEDYPRDYGSSMTVSRVAFNGPADLGSAQSSSWEYPASDPHSIVPRAINFGACAEVAPASLISHAAPNFSESQVTLWRGQCVQIGESQLQSLLAQQSAQEESMRPALENLRTGYG